jgi:hypothetical protein
VLCFLAALGVYVLGIPKLPLTSTAGFARLADQYGWIIAEVRNGRGMLDHVGDLRPGDCLIYDEQNDARNSGGPRGHFGIVEHVEGSTIYTTESRGGRGVGIYPRDASFWCFAFRPPVRFDGATPQPPPPPWLLPQEEDDDMELFARIAWPHAVGGDDNLHTFWIESSGELGHRWENATAWHKESLTDVLHTGAFSYPQKPSVFIAPSGALVVGAMGKDGIANFFTPNGKGGWVQQVADV